MAADGWPVYLDPDARAASRETSSTTASSSSSLDGITHLVHLAASVGVGQSMTNIADYTRNNTMAAALMLEVLSTLRAIASNASHQAMVCIVDVSLRRG